jgi:dephospho-CoA kinase
MTLIIGLTGGIATGKSTVSDMFKSHSIPVVDADQIAREVVEIGKPAYQKIVETFGDEVILCTGHLNRRKLAQIVFSDEDKIKKLNQIVHPEVKNVIKEEIRKYRTFKEPYVVIDVPLLFESQFDKLCDMILVVFTNEETQIERLMNRDHIDREDALKRIQAQMNIKDKLFLADFKIDNSLSILETRKQFDMFLKKIEKRNHI